MKLHIPTIGELITLKEDWSFDLYDEYRNRSLFNVMDECRQWRGVDSVGKLTLPAGSILKVVRIYIRCNAQDYDSVTFTIQSVSRNDLEFSKPDCGTHVFEWNKRRKPRFWVKLYDVNQMHIMES